jgi:hypothetical protein
VPEFVNKTRDSIPWNEVKKNLGAYVDPRGLLKKFSIVPPSEMTLTDVITLYSHIVQVQDSTNLKLAVRFTFIK